MAKKELFTTNDTKHTKRTSFFLFLSARHLRRNEKTLNLNLFLFVYLVCFVVKKELFTTNDTKHTKRTSFFLFLSALHLRWNEKALNQIPFFVRVFGVFRGERILSQKTAAGMLERNPWGRRLNLPFTAQQMRYFTGSISTSAFNPFTVSVQRLPGCAWAKSAGSLVS